MYNLRILYLIYFLQVVDPNPVPGLSVSPVQGVVPVGGTTELKIHLTPSAVMKFDTRLEVAIRGWKTIDLRMGGTVEPPLVDIDMVRDPPPPPPSYPHKQNLKGGIEESFGASLLGHLLTW